METKKCQARYGKIGRNPFSNNLGDIVSITVDIDSKKPLVEVESMAKEATPKGYEYIDLTTE